MKNQVKKMDILKSLNEVNDVPVYSVFDEEFLLYGRVVSGFDFSEMIAYMKTETEIPDGGNVYYPSVEQLEKTEVFPLVQSVLYGGMPIQAGYCNGRNSTYNGFEYHKCSEINIAASDFVLVLGHKNLMKNNSFRVGNEKVFFVPQGTAIEMYQTTLHLSPCRVCDEGFRDIVILLKGTNTPLEGKPICNDEESRILLMKNKWVIAHKDREPLVKQGAHIGLIGENKEIKY